MGESLKVREIRLRRWAERLGLFLQKSKVRKFNVNDKGQWRVRKVNKYGKVMVGTHFDMTMDDVEEYLASYEERLKQQQ